MIQGLSNYSYKVSVTGGNYHYFDFWL